MQKTILLSVVSLAIAGLLIGATVNSQPSESTAPAAIMERSAMSESQRSAPDAWIEPVAMNLLDDNGASSTIQHDGPEHLHIAGDAPGACADVDSRRYVEVDGNRTIGIMVPEDDESDAFWINIGDEYQDERLEYLLNFTAGEGQGQGGIPYEFHYDIVDAACSFSVFDPSADIYHPENAAPAQPFTNGTDHNVTSGYACASSWTFKVDHGEDPQPGQLYLQWSNGDTDYVDPAQIFHDDKKGNGHHKDKTGNGHDKHGDLIGSEYTSNKNTENTLTRIVLDAPASVDFDLQIVSGPCELSTWTVEPPSRDPTSGEFTVVEPGNYVLLVWIVHQADEGSMLDKDCDWSGACLIAQDAIGYDNILKKLSTA